MGLQFSRTGGSFQLSWNSRMILAHEIGRPVVRLGTATDISKSHSGFFNIKEKQRKMKALREITAVLESEKSIVLEFENELKLTCSEEDGRIAIMPELKSGNYNRFELYLTADPTEQVFGCGEQYGKLNLRGNKVPVWISEPGVGRRFDPLTIGFAIKTSHMPRWYNTYISMPTWVTSEGLYCHSTASVYSVLDFRQKDRHGVYIWGIPEKIVIGVETSFSDAVSALNAFLGRQPAPPEWVYDGMMLGVQGGKEVVDRKIAAVRSGGVLLNAVWCQDWEGSRKTNFGKQLRWAWEYDDTLYPDLPGYIKELKKQGVRYLGYNNTFLSPGSWMFDEAKQKGYLIKKASGEVYTVDVPFDPAGMVDFSNPEAKKWLKEIIRKNMIDIGLSGWMADMGEMVPHDCVVHSGEKGTSYHNKYPVDWAALNYEAILEAGMEKEILHFYRAGYAGSARFCNMFWTGDQMVDWTKEDGLPSSILGSITLGISGVGYIHSDIGGYTTLAYKKRSAELLMRWAEYAVFSQSMRSHEGNRPPRNEQIAENRKVINHLAKMTDVFTKLKPYHLEVSREYQEKGYPSMRTPGFHYSDELQYLPKWQYQYLYGRDLLVAPVLNPGKKTWKVRLPDDNWVHLWSGKSYNGNAVVKVDAPIGQPPVFFRADSAWKSLFRACVV